MARLLYDSIIKNGTVNEPKGKPEPEFALPATVNWMASLRAACSEEKLNFNNCCVYYNSNFKRRNLEELQLNSIYEQLFLSLNYLSGIDFLRQSKNPSDVARMGILSWYYGVYNAASAMICARDGSLQETHERTARQWYSQIVCNELALRPFDANISSLVSFNIKREVDNYRGSSSGSLKKKLSTDGDINGVLAEYISGTATWYRSRSEEKIRGGKEFSALGVENFRTKAARNLRDKALEKKSIGFLHQAYRYRGKANYREALFLAYGKTANSIMSEFIDDLFFVLFAFISMSGAYCALSMGATDWNAFIEDVKANSAFSYNVDQVWQKR